jgi:hypothetical protein
MPLEEPLKSSLTMHTIILEVLTDGEKTTSIQCRNTHAFIEYHFTDETKVSAEYTNMNYDMKQPGGLTDVQFDENPRQSVRSQWWLVHLGMCFH